MAFNINELPDSVRLEIKKKDLEAFGKLLIEAAQNQTSSNDSLAEDAPMSFKEGIAYLKMAASTGYQKVNNGTLPYYKVGRRIYFRKSELDAYLATGQHNPLENA